MVDARVAELNQSIESRLSRYLGDRTHIQGISGVGVAQRQYMAEHQPTDGQWNSPCSGSHDASTPWPCDGVLKFDSPMAYLD